MVASLQSNMVVNYHAERGKERPCRDGFTIQYGSQLSKQKDHSPYWAEKVYNPIW